MLEGVGGWKKREIETFRFFCERVSREDKSKARSEGAALLPACTQQQDVRERGRRWAYWPPQAASSSLPAYKGLYIQLSHFIP